MISNSTLLVFTASEPPFRTEALPLFTHSEAICTSASGRDSKITPITPMGHVTFERISPSSNCFFKTILLRGSSRPIKLWMPSMQSRNFFSSNSSLFNMGSVRPFDLPTLRSVRLASKILSLQSTREELMLFRAEFLTSEVELPKIMLSCFTCLKRLN